VKQDEGLAGIDCASKTTETTISEEEEPNNNKKRREHPTATTEKHQSTKRSKKYLYGNYDRYYGYRLFKKKGGNEMEAEGKDSRLQLFKQFRFSVNWFLSFFLSHCYSQRTHQRMVPRQALFGYRLQQRLFDF